MNRTFEFWDALAQHHSRIENSYLNLPAIRHILRRIESPVLVVGAGQGLIVAELQKRGLQCDGVDLSPEMIRYAKVRRGLDLVEADARTMPFEKGAYKTILYATGVVDFTSDEEAILEIMNEGKRIADSSGSILVAFYRMSGTSEKFLARLGLLKNNVLRFKDMLEFYRLSPMEALAWVAKQAKVSYARAAMQALHSWACSSWQEKRNALQMQRIFANASDAETLIRTAPEQQPYRNEAEIRNLFARLGIQIMHFETTDSCYIASIESCRASRSDGREPWNQ